MKQVYFMISGLHQGISAASANYIISKQTFLAEDVSQSTRHRGRLILSYRSQLCNLSSQHLSKFKRMLPVQILWAWKLRACLVRRLVPAF
jgi:hypothetical protein